MGECSEIFIFLGTCRFCGFFFLIFFLGGGGSRQNWTSLRGLF